MKKILIIALLFLSACSSKKDDTVSLSCSVVDAYGDHYHETMVAKGNKLQSNRVVVTRDYQTNVDDGAFTVAQLTAEYDKLVEKYKDVPGYNFEYKQDGAKFVETIRFDFTTISFDLLVELGYLDTANYEYIALDLTIEGLKRLGYICDE